MRKDDERTRCDGKSRGSKQAKCCAVLTAGSYW
jgi:hypothetical protein